MYYLEDSGEWPYNFDGGPSGKDWVVHDPKAQRGVPSGSHDCIRVFPPIGRTTFQPQSEWFGLSEREEDQN